MQLTMIGMRFLVIDFLLYAMGSYERIESMASGM